MRDGTHPEYGPVVFRDRAANHAFLTRLMLAATAGRRRSTGRTATPTRWWTSRSRT